jgi:DNA-directed RNA polymerase specialized sigma24 family protein
MEAISARCLLSACAAGTGDGAWNEFVRRFRPGLESGVRRGMRRTMLPPEELEDLMQEVYCRLLEGGGRRLLAPHAANDREVGAFLRRLAENVVLDRQRASRAAKRGADRVVALRGGDDAVVDRAPSAEERLLSRERSRHLLRLCGGRTSSSGAVPARAQPTRRTLWIVRKALFEGWTSREIARALGGAVTPGGVDAIVGRAYRRLRAQGVAVPRRRRSSRRAR